MTEIESTPTPHVPHVLLCSACFDHFARGRFTAIVPRAVCARCGRLCLGYVTDPDAEGR